MDDVLVLPRHARRLKYCMLGVRRFCIRHDLDFRRFLASGLPASHFESTGDAMAIKLAEVARGKL